jgi:hypothetical protein
MNIQLTKEAERVDKSLYEPLVNNDADEEPFYEQTESALTDQ